MQRSYSFHSILALAALAAAMPAARAQFTSGSTGADGALDIPANAGLVIFDPVARNIDQDSDNVFHFTTITIGDNAKLVLKASKMRKNTAVVFLATGAVRLGLNSQILLNGENGPNVAVNVQTSRRSAEPGPGGFQGGLASRNDTGVSPATDGYGPVGSKGLAYNTGCSGNQTTMAATSGHMSMGMIPLVGGAGGGGAGCDKAGSIGGNGGAGGGAIRIVSSSSISMDVNAGIYANGGQGGLIDGASSLIQSGMGGGGMIHLIAPTLNFSSGDELQALNPGYNNLSPLIQGSGVIRMNATTFNGLPNSRPASVNGALYNLPLPAGIPEVMITQVGGNAVANPPSGSLSGADVVISLAAAAQVVIATKNIPPGTSVNLRINSETVADQSITCAPITGTLALGSATCQATFPLGANITVASATW